ncbi:transposase [Microtetraspora sp. AC03309]|uniref:transposase n=1 Tax=Microtetraspora sp. AC03309 TaxID=2779376 RepID=UPI001E28EFC0|nr:transposase [Microtetraspora sp. AC03309]MCC5575737.1 transposase [Microtetraspora sp. AC03309]
MPGLDHPHTISLDANLAAQATGNRPWLTVFQLPAYAPEFNLVEAVWAPANLAVHTVDDLLRIVKNRLKRMQYRPSLITAFTAGKDAAKRVPGRKRGLAVDVLGLVIAVVMLAASVHENVAGIALLDRVVAGTEGTVTKALVDQGFKNAVVAHGVDLGIDVKIVERNPADKGFVPQRTRWVVEQTYGILMFHRRLVRDYEHLPASESRVYWAMTDVMSRRLTRGTAPSWRWT